MLDTLRQDARYAGRALARSPLFTLTAVASLAIGIGATTAIVTLANTFLLRTPPGIRAAERVVTIGRTQEGRGFDNFSYPDFADYRAGAKSFAGMAALRIEPRPVSLAGPDGGEAVEATIVSGTFFQVLGTRPAVGRFFLPGEDQVPRRDAVVVLSHRFWRERFDGDSAIAGRSIALNGTPFTVVGVAEEGFHGPFVLAPDLWIPVMAAPLVGYPDELLTARQAVWLMAVGRLAPDAAMSAAQAELSTIARGFQQAHPRIYEGRGVRIMPTSLFPGDMRTMVAGFIAMLLAIAGLVLLIASTNVAGMLLARASVRRREIAVRLAIGATRGRLLGMLVTESVFLFLAAGVAGLLASRVVIAGMLALVPALPVQLAIDPAIDWRVLLVALAITLAGGLLAGLAPALQSTRPALVPALKTESTQGSHRLRLRSGLLVAQIAFSMLLLVAAGLFARALATARAIDPGFDPHGVHVASLDLELARYDTARGPLLASRLLERTGALPGVQAVALSAMLPLDGGGLGLGPIQVPGRPAPDPERGHEADWNVVTPGYFDVLRLPLVRGRGFTDADRRGSADVAIVNETLARRMFGTDDVVGRTFRNEDRTVTVVGVARDAKYRSLGESPRGFVYVPFAQWYFTRMSLMVRTGTEGTMAPSLRRTVAELDPALPILDQRRLVDQIAVSLFPQRVALWVAGSLGGVALLLALLGIYGVTAYGVTQRTREIGIRIALGAERERVLALVLRQGVVLAAMGVGAGLLLALAATRVLASLLYGVAATDPIAIGGAAVVLVGAALVASWLPARRAAGVDPAVALRGE